MCYEVNVAQNGVHVFNTGSSVTSTTRLIHIIKTFADKFPKKEGYEITVIKRQSIGTVLDIAEIMQE